MSKRAVLFLVWSLAVGLPLVAAGEQEDPHHPSPASSGSEIQLSPLLRQALAREMLGIQNAMMDMIPSIAAGDWPRVAKLAGEIEGSFIIKQALSAEQLEELHHALPAEFLELDRTFHRQAGMLAHVAREGHADLVGFYFYKLNEGCVGCHGKYARHRFPAFAPASAEPEHAH